MNDHVEPIAIIGMGARLPGARDVGEFWSNLRDGRETISFLEDEELLENGVSPHDLANPDYVKAVPLVPDVKSFDSGLFGMTAREADICDPALRLFLEVAHAAIENSGYDVTKVGDGFGVFSASGPCDYQDIYLRQSLKYKAADIFQMSTLNNTDYSATLAAYKLNLRGPAMTIVTACSSSLVSLHVACQSLRYGECDAAVVGGANVEAPYGQGHMWVPGAVRSRDGHCRPFDAHATGTMFGSGSAAVVLKRLSDAQRDNDNIRAVVLGSALNNDGSDKVSFSAPSITGQSSVIMEAMAMAGVQPSDISYVEAHGTATALGDPIEIAALSEAYRRLGGGDLPRDSIGIGSVKSNIGHLVWAAGVSQLVKVALALENEEIPPTVNFTEPNPKLELERTPLFVNDTLRPWPRVPGTPRRAGLSSLGIGGTNAHTILEEAPPRAVPAAYERPRIVVWSGRTRDAVDAGRGRLVDFFRGDGAAAFQDAASTLARGRTAHKVRAAAVGRDAAGAAAALESGAFATSEDAPPAERPLAFLFPGQGAQHSRMATDLYRQLPVFAGVMDRCLDGFRAHGLELHEPWQSAEPDALTDTRLAQPMLFAVEYALAATLRHWGLRPAALLGHSIGELTAAAVAEVFSFDDAIRLVAARANAMGDAPHGAMLSVPVPAAEVAAMLPDSLVVSVRNAPNQAVVAGAVDDVAAFERDLAARGIAARRLATSHAFHSPMMADAARAFGDSMRSIALHPPQIPIVSAATGATVTDEQATDPAFWADQVARPVHFDRALDTLLADPWTLVEVGPGHVLTGLARRHAGVRDKRSAVLPTLDAGRDDGPGELERVLDGVGRLWVAGHEVDWAGVDAEHEWQRVVVPGYPYQRKLHWVTPTTGPAAPRRADEAAEPAVEVEPPAAQPEQLAPATPFSTVTWIEAPAVAADRAEPGALTLAFLPADRAMGMTVLGPLLQSGTRVVRVRPGDRFSVSGDEFRVRPGVAADVEQVFAHLAADGRSPEVLIHAWGVPTWDYPTSRTVDEQLDLSFVSLLALVQHGTRRAVNGRFPRVVVLASRLADVSGVEALDPVKATLVGLTRTLAREAPGVVCKIIDIGPNTAEEALVAELATADGQELVALRGHRRWVPDEQPLDLAAPAAEPRPGGVYLITGGLGGLGLATGKALARTGWRPKLVLVGRTGLPADAEQVAERDPRLRHILDEIEEMTELGAQVRTMACDIGDPRQVNRVLDVVTAQFGPVNGVLHLAGVAGDGMLQLRAPGDARAVLHPKVLGTLVLETALQDRPPLDFFVSFSSRAALRGLTGSGDYAAANAVLDAYAAAGPGRHRRLSVNWPAWSTVGMAADHAHPAWLGPKQVELTFDADRDWILDEHRLDGRPVLPGTGHLDLVMTSFRGLDLISPDDAIMLEDAVFQNALVVDTPREVHVRFAPSRDSWRFEVRSRPVGAGDDEWSRHVEGRIAGCARKDDVRPPEPFLERLPEVEPPSLKPGPGRLFALGGRWQGIVRMWRSDDRRDRMVQLVLPDAYVGDLDTCQAHPALLDGASASVRDDLDDIHLPFMYRRAVFHRPFPQAMYSHVVRRPDKPGVLVADITVVAPDGTLLAEIEGYTMRKVGRHPRFLDQPAEAVATPEAPPVIVDTTPAPLADGIDPDEGGRLLTLLLGARTPHQVLVRPYVGGRPVPIAARAAAPVDLVTAAGPEPVLAVPLATAPEPTAGQPAGTVEAELSEMWREALGVDTLGPDDEFFELGGDSLSAVQLMRRVRERFGVQMSIGVLFDCPTVRALSVEITRLVAEG
ncbi:hypothetical protein Ais01nite_08220 [Asanoa ishikariensis]|uniref:Acyl transferase domain-containing protein n=1 Tax=Asanoa ishikariensis TaxID=137265 RepID=A0A1H3TBS4_9ACTN|nr:type I polyketide synthase [Asanoa ishikariensis]GIF62787.1 hypothetical protein Ais01nite_08220 [Asanoa ishikariensis]SDZ47155.1 Acyl transferase domain-containing protein [Asanoa ishikariensis]